MKKKLIKIDKKVRIKFVKDRPGHDVRYALNSIKIKKKFKWKSLTNINNGLSKTIDWYVNNTQYFKSISKKDYVKRIGLKI